MLKKETIKKLAEFCKTPEYSLFVRKLIVQGLIKIEEQTVEIQARAEDKAICAKEVGAVIDVVFCCSLLCSWLFP